MGPVHIVFILINLAVPSWLYFRSDHDGPDIAWGQFEDNMEKIVATSGDFGGCSKQEVVAVFRQLCEKSLEQWTDADSVIVERAAPDIVFTCEVRNDASFVQWRIERSDDYDLNCTPSRKIASDNASPAFVFDKKGELSAIEFFARTGERQSVNIANCRRKLKLALSRPPRGTGMELVDRMPRLKSDPRDFRRANRLCYEYDVDDDWSKLRAQVSGQQ